MMSGRFQDAIPGLFGALFGAGVLGWGAGWIRSVNGRQATLLAGQSHEALYQAGGTKSQIHKNIGWHTFRHSFGTLLKANGEDVKTVQELLRHANSRITLDVYTQAVNSHKRAAQSKVVEMMVPNLGETRGNSHPRSA